MVDGTGVLDIRLADPCPLTKENPQLAEAQALQHIHTSTNSRLRHTTSCTRSKGALSPAINRT